MVLIINHINQAWVVYLRFAWQALFGCLFMWCSSCVSPKQVVYFQSNPGEQSRVQRAEVYVPRIRPGDVLSIQISSLSPEASTFFNPYAMMRVANQRTSQPMPGTLPEMEGYLVSPAGTIELPLAGELVVGKLTVNECGQLIREKLRAYLKEPGRP
jgi:polysaccharide biosynthesis/export protein